MVEHYDDCESIANMERTNKDLVEKANNGGLYTILGVMMIAVILAPHVFTNIENNDKKFLLTSTTLATKATPVQIGLIG